MHGCTVTEEIVAYIELAVDEKVAKRTGEFVPQQLVRALPV